jgi:hypothetical protein
MITIEIKDEIDRVKVLSAMNYLKMVESFRERMDKVYQNRKHIHFNKDVNGFMGLVEFCRDLKYSGISDPKLPANFLISGKDLISELNKLDNNSEIILVCKDIMLWIIDIYLDLKISIILINRNFPMSDRDKISNGLYFMLKEAISIKNTKQNTNDPNLQKLLDAQILTKSYFEKTGLLKDYYSMLNQKLNDILKPTESLLNDKVNINISDFKQIFLRMSDFDGIRFIQKFLLPNLSTWILTKDGSTDKYLILKPIFEIICPDWELNKMPAQGYRNENDYAWHKIDSMLKPDKFLKDLNSRI